jgi:hypothetical protein
MIYDGGWKEESRRRKAEDGRVICRRLGFRNNAETLINKVIYLNTYILSAFVPLRLYSFID